MWKCCASCAEPIYHTFPIAKRSVANLSQQTSFAVSLIVFGQFLREGQPEGKQRNQEIEYAAFQSPLELLNEIEKGAAFDIMMPGETGIDAAAEIRGYDSNVKIIFLTSSAEYAVHSYAVGAYFYQLKPIWEESFFRLMDSAIAACEKERSDCLILRCKSGITRIELRQLEYCEVIHRTLSIHLHPNYLSALYRKETGNTIFPPEPSADP